MIQLVAFGVLVLIMPQFIGWILGKVLQKPIIGFIMLFLHLLLYYGFVYFSYEGAVTNAQLHHHRCGMFLLTYVFLAMAGVTIPATYLSLIFFDFIKKRIASN